MKLKINALLLLTIIAATIGCAPMKKLTANGVNFVASVGTNAVGLFDIATPLVQDPAQPGDTNAVVVNPVILSAAQTAATQFGGPYGAAAGVSVGLIAGVIGTYFTQRRRKAAAASVGGGLS